MSFQLAIKGQHKCKLAMCHIKDGGRIPPVTSPRAACKRSILKLTLRRGQFNFSIVYIFISCKENGHFNVVLVGQLRFDCHLYCGRSCRMQGNHKQANLFSLTTQCYLKSPLSRILTLVLDCHVPDEKVQTHHHDNCYIIPKGRILKYKLSQLVV